MTVGAQSTLEGVCNGCFQLIWGGLFPWPFYSNKNTHDIFLGYIQCLKFSQQMLHVPGSSSVLESILQPRLCLHSFMQGCLAVPLRKTNLVIYSEQASAASSFYILPVCKGTSIWILPNSAAGPG